MDLTSDCRRRATPLAPLTTMGLPAEAQRFFPIASPDELDALRAAGQLHGAVILGGGSNTLFLQPTIEAPVLHPVMNAVTFSPEPGPDGLIEVRAEAGTVLDTLIDLTCARGLWGIENLSGIPGHVGGAAVQNVGAYGTELADAARIIHLYDLVTGTRFEVDAADMRYSYRHSALKDPDIAGRWMVTAVTFALSPEPRPVLSYKALAAEVERLSHAPRPADMRRLVKAIREAKLPDPATVGSVGSYFVNPVVPAQAAAAFAAAHPEAPCFTRPDGTAKLSAAWLIDHAGCKPLSVGGASLWPSQPLVLVNTRGEATAADVIGLEEAVRERVREAFGVTLTCEAVKVPDPLTQP